MDWIRDPNLVPSVEWRKYFLDPGITVDLPMKVAQPTFVNTTSRNWIQAILWIEDLKKKPKRLSSKHFQNSLIAKIVQR